MKLFLALLLLSSPALAESHGGVTAANAQFSAVSLYALDSDASGLYRVMGVQRLGSCGDHGQIYQISYGSMDSEGNESEDFREKVVASYPLAGESVKVTEFQEPNCR